MSHRVGLPYDLVLVRHGESEGNVALNASKHGNHQFFNIPGFRERTGNDWRLTLKGIRQAQQTGARLRQEFPNGFDRYYASDFARARETAALLEIPGARWFINLYLHEQLWGRQDVIPRDELEKRFPGVQARRNRNRYYGSYDGGESMGMVCLRQDRVLETLGRECGGQRVILVCHGNVIWAYRLLIERLTPRDYHLLEAANDPANRIHNGQIFHYTRRDPDQPARILDSFGWRRTIRPASPVQVDEGWHAIERPSFTNEQLLAGLDYIPRLID